MSTTSSYPSVPAGTKTLKLNTGASIPLLGLGTWQSGPGQVGKAVEIALKNGYRHIDCAFAYDNEEEVGQGIKASGVAREDIFVTTKLWGTYHRRVEQNLDISLQKLGLDYVDLYLIHWPIALEVQGDAKIPLREDGSRAIDEKRPFADTWAEMAGVQEKGKARAIGVSNVSKTYLEDLLSKTSVVPAANQIELHPYLPQHDLVNFCNKNGILCEAYSPLGSTNSPLLKDEVLVEIAKAKGVDVAQVIISWQAQRGVAVLPKSVTESRIISNAKLVELTSEEMNSIDELHKQDGKHQRFIKPKWGVDLKFELWQPTE